MSDKEFIIDLDLAAIITNLSEIPQYVQEYTSLHNIAQRDLQDLKNKYDVVFANYYNDISAHPDKYDIKKKTEAGIVNYINTLADIRELKKEISNQILVKNNYKNDADSHKMRMDVMVQMIKMTQNELTANLLQAVANKQKGKK